MQIVAQVAGSWPYLYRQEEGSISACSKAMYTVAKLQTVIKDTQGVHGYNAA